MDHQSFHEPRPAGSSTVYAFDGQMLIIAAIAAVFLFVVLLVSLHLYAQWWLRNGAASGRTHIFVINDDRHTADSTADHGLEPEVLSSLPVFTYSSKKIMLEQEQEQEQEQVLLECAVCLSEFEENEIGRLLPKCNHSFHIECIDMWFHSHSTCPLCRSSVESASDQPETCPVVMMEVGEEISGQELGSSSSSGVCDKCQHEGCESVAEEGVMSLARRRKAVKVKIDVPQPRIENELTQGSPMTRMLSFKRLLSMGGMSPSASRMTPRYRAAELDLEGGLGEPIQIYTPK